VLDSWLHKVLFSSSFLPPDFSSTEAFPAETHPLLDHLHGPASFLLLLLEDPGFTARLVHIISALGARRPVLSSTLVLSSSPSRVEGSPVSFSTVDRISRLRILQSASAPEFSMPGICSHLCCLLCYSFGSCWERAHYRVKARAVLCELRAKEHYRSAPDSVLPPMNPVSVRSGVASSQALFFGAWPSTGQCFPRCFGFWHVQLCSCCNSLSVR
jgi:hypothetical protein